MATHWSGYSAVPTAARSGWAIRYRESATIRKSARALHTMSLDTAEGPCLKKGGGLRSRVPNGMANCAPGPAERTWDKGLRERRLVPAPPGGTGSGLFAREDASQPLHALQGDAAAPHHAGQRVQDLIGRNGERARYAFGQVASLDLDFPHFAAGEGRPDGLLDGFGRGLT